MVAGAVPGHVYRPILAIKYFSRPRNSLIERRCQSDELKSRSGLVECRDRTVHSRFRWRLVRRVGIELRPVRQAENFAGIWIHHHHGAGHGMRPGNRCGQLALCDVLDFFVECENDVRAGLAPGFSAIEPALARVRHYDDFFALAADLAIQFVFDPAQSLFIEVDEAQHMPCPVALRRDFDHALLLPLRPGHVFAVTEKLQVSQPSEYGGQPEQCHAGNDQQPANRFAVTIRIDRPAVTLGTYRYAATCGGVSTVFWHGEIKSISAPPGSSFAGLQTCCLALHIENQNYGARFGRAGRTAPTSAPSGASYSCTCVGSGSVKPSWRRAITSMRIGLRSPAISNFKDEFTAAASACLAFTSSS